HEFPPDQRQQESAGIAAVLEPAYGWSNELFLAGVKDRTRRFPKTHIPQITVNYSGGRSIIAGSDEFSDINELDADTYEITDNLTIPRGNHSFVVGTRNELVKIRNLFAQ